MLRTIKARLAASRRRDADQKEGGFTLIELMVVVLIIAILLAIAVPTFLGAQNKAKDRSAQSSLRNALTAAKTIQADAGDYATATDAALEPIEPSLSYVATGVESDNPKEVSVSGAGAVWAGAAMSKTGSCFFIKDSNAGTQYTKALAADDCSGTGATTTAAVWSDGW